MEQTKMEQTCPTCPCPHHKAMPILVILFGLLFLLDALGAVSAGTTSIVWPVIVILAGLQKLFGHRCKCCAGEEQPK